mgnify:CR=1 FL=1
MEENKRMDKINYYLDIAEAVSKRGTCLRKNFGCIIVKNDVNKLLKKCFICYSSNMYFFPLISHHFLPNLLHWLLNILSYFGCIIVKNDEIIATGYTGSPRGRVQPKRRWSKARTGLKRSTWKLGKPNYAECPHCHELFSNLGLSL